MEADKEFIWYPTAKTATFAWEVLFDKCKVPLKERVRYKRFSLKNGIRGVRIGPWYGITNHPEVYDPQFDGEHMWLVYHNEYFGRMEVLGFVRPDKEVIFLSKRRYN